MKNNLPIGVFDSGIGGLTVLRELMSQLPRESFIYLGDTARLPYGTKSAETVKQYVLTMADILYKKGIKLLVVACNTATAAALSFLREKYLDLPIVGVIEPGANAAITVTKNNHILLLATQTTINSRAYHRAIYALNKDTHIQTQACSLFVALAEEGWINNAVSLATIHQYLACFKKTDCDTVILGCTHFPVFIKQIQHFFGSEVSVINSAYETALLVKKTLKNLNLYSDIHRGVQYLVTDSPERFLQVGSIFLDKVIDDTSVHYISHFSSQDLTNTSII